MLSVYNITVSTSIISPDLEQFLEEVLQLADSKYRFLAMLCNKIRLLLMGFGACLFRFKVLNASLNRLYLLNFMRFAHAQLSSLVRYIPLNSLSLEILPYFYELESCFICIN